jgi:hypothetical protein
MGTTAPRRRQGLEPHAPRWFVPRLEFLEDRIAPAVVTPFIPRFSTDAPGNIAIIGNTLETASTVNQVTSSHTSRTTPSRWLDHLHDLSLCAVLAPLGSSS